MEQRMGRYSGRGSVCKSGTFPSCSKLGEESEMGKQPASASELAQEDRDPNLAPTRRPWLPGILVPRLGCCTDVLSIVNEPWLCTEDHRGFHWIDADC